MNAFEKAKLNEYWQVKNAIVKNNIIVDCATAFVVGAGKNELRVLAPKRVSIIDNYIISPGVLIDQKDTPLESIVKNNQVKGTSLEDGFIALSVPVSKNSNNLFQIGEMPLQTFWTTEKIGPVWFKVGYFKWRVVD
jgi:poly(beta-D-mannuronate) lyase